MEIGVPQVGREIVFKGTETELDDLAAYAQHAARTGKANLALIHDGEISVKIRFRRLDPPPEPRHGWIHRFRAWLREPIGHVRLGRDGEEF